MSPSLRRLLPRLGLASFMILLPVGGLELFLRRTTPPARPSFNLICTPACPEVFRLNPARGDVSSQGFRDREFAPQAPPGVTRVMILGDSLPYGLSVTVPQTFPKVAERLLGPSAEIVNTGVAAYSPYNERALYQTRGRELHPSFVVVSICLNDVADPLLHWGTRIAGASKAVPDAAIPNPAYHRDHAMATWAELQKPKGGRLQKTAIYQRLIAPLGGPGIPDVTIAGAGGERFPAFLVGEDTLSIEVLTDPKTPEWTWLRGQLDGLAADIRADGAEPLLLINPLSYQLRPGYPAFPQTVFADYCAERKLKCLDVLPALREGGGEKLFLGVHSKGVLDVWHYTSQGHEVVGKALGEWLRGIIDKK